MNRYERYWFVGAAGIAAWLAWLAVRWLVGLGGE